MSKSENSLGNARYELTKVALGESVADLAIVNGNIVNVYTGEVIAGDTILIKDDKIAYVGKYAKRGIGSNTLILNAEGKILLPGFIDGHTHMDYIFSTSEAVRYALKSGTTTIITEVVELAFRLGYRGILEYLKSIRNQPVKFWFTVPPMGTISPVARKHALSLSEIRRLLRRKECVGTGEIYWGLANTGDEQQLQIITETLKAGKKIEGHSAGATANKLQAYINLGITSDHEPITDGEALERLRLGLSVLIREGEVRQDLEDVSRIRNQKLDFRRLAMSTDGVGPLQITTQGFMDHVVRKAVDLGFPPVQAIQMATLNVAEHFNLDDFIGGIAPGRFADIVLVSNLNDIHPETVISNGRLAVQNGEVIAQPRCHNYPQFTRQSIHLDTIFKPEDFTVHTNIHSPRVKVRVIDQITHILTREAILELPVSDGSIEMDPENDIIKVAAIEHIHTPGKTFTGFIRGLGLKRGAIATSTAWDIGDIMVAGTNEADMALAVNRIIELRGGTLVCLEGKVLAELAFPVGGLISDKPMEILAADLGRIQTAAADLGCSSPDIRTTISVLATPAIPYIRICESGLFSVRLNKMVDLVIEG